MTSPAFGHILSALGGGDDLTAVPLDEVTHRCAAVTGMSGASIVLVADDEQDAVTATSGPAVTELEQVQFMVGEGPGRDAHRTGRVVLAPALGTPDDRWPEFSAAANRLGLEAAFAFPLRVGAITLGPLTLYRTNRGALDGTALTEALVLADVITQIVLAWHGSDDDVVSMPVSDLLDDRAVVHQATGMVSVQLSCSVRDALTRIRAYAFANDVPVDVVAHQIVERTLRFHP